MLNCGHCGECSNVNDASTHCKTKQTLTSDAVCCSTMQMLCGHDAAFQCFKKRVGLTDGCNNCFIQNVKCGCEKCMFVGLKHKVLPPCLFFWDSTAMNKKSYFRGHDPAVECDEKMCGTQFVKCAGANRRKIGVATDVMHNNNKELCQCDVDVDWMLETNDNDNSNDDDEVKALSPSSSDMSSSSSSSLSSQAQQQEQQHPNSRQETAHIKNEELQK